jgi:DNA polymerase III subunit epsilon
LFDYTDRKGHIRLGIDYIRRGGKPLMRFGTQAEARHFLLTKSDEYKLCPKLCAIDTSESEACNAVITKHCTGNCRIKSKMKAYNKRVQQFIDELDEYKPSYALLGKGRKTNEYAVVYVQKGTFKGFGFVGTDMPLQNADELETFIKPCKATIDSELIVSSYLRRNPSAKVVMFS